MLSPCIQFGRLLSVPSGAEIRPYLLNEAGKMGDACLEHFSVNPGLQKDLSFWPEAPDHGGEQTHFLLFSIQRERPLEWIKAHSKLPPFKDAIVGEPWPVIGHRLTARAEAAVESHLMDSSAKLSLRLSPVAEGIAVKLPVDIPLSIAPLLHSAILSCCVLGIDGRSPLVDVEVTVLNLAWQSLEGFFFRQNCAVHKAVRACFIEALKT